MQDEPYWLDRVLADNAEDAVNLAVSIRDANFSYQEPATMPDDTRPVVTEGDQSRLTHHEPSAAMIERPHASQFIGWMADRFQEKHVPPLSREAAIAMAVAYLEFSEADAPFGHPDYAWDEEGAHILADDEIETSWEMIG